MRIASPDELASELRSLLAYAEGGQPSRAKIASGLNGLADRLAADDRWRYNFIGGDKSVTLRVDVTAAEMNGWRAGVVIENDAGGYDNLGMLKSVFARSFEGAVDEAKKLARRYKIKWDPKHYSTQKDHKPGTPPPEEQ